MNLRRLLPVLIHPVTSLTILPLMMLAGCLRFGFHLKWAVVNLVGGTFFVLGYLIGKKVRDELVALLATLLIFLMVWVSFRWAIGELLAMLISFLWTASFIQASILNERLSRDNKYPLAILALYALGVVLTVHSSLVNGGWERIRSLPNTPEEGAFGMFLIMITFPFLGWRALNYSTGRHKTLAFIFILFTSFIMMLHGFRSDVIMIILSTTILLIGAKKGSQAMLLISSVLIIFLAVDVIRFEAKLSIIDRVAYRLATTYQYSSEVLNVFWGNTPPIPLWIYSIPIHPTQLIGRAIFLKDYGITTSLFCGFFIVNGFPTLLVFSTLMGVFSSYSYRKFLNGDPLPYSLVWPLIITRMEVGMTQLDIVVLAAAASFKSVGSILDRGA